jgi:hypothetical protein
VEDIDKSYDQSREEGTWQRTGVKSVTPTHAPTNETLVLECFALKSETQDNRRWSVIETRTEVT